MTTFITVSLLMSAFGGFVRLFALVLLDYPRKSEVSRASDAILILASLAWCLWAAKLIGWL